MLIEKERKRGMPNEKERKDEENKGRISIHEQIKIKPGN